MANPEDDPHEREVSPDSGGDTEADDLWRSGVMRRGGQAVLELLEQIGFRPIDVGPLSAARYLEGIAFLNISLNAHNGWSWGTGWKLVGPTA